MEVSDARVENEKLRQTITELKAENALHKAYLSQYEDDFEHERQDRIRAVQELVEIKEELKSYKRPIGAQSNAPENKMIKKAALIEENQRLKKENDDVKHKLQVFMDLLSSKQTELEAVKANLEAMEIIMQKQLKVLNVQLAEAQEEIAVKVAQVKQYQKQVEAYKGQAPQPEQVRKPDCKGTSLSEPLHPVHPDPACDGDKRLNPPSSSSLNAAPNDGDCKEDDSDDDLPPPMFHKPLHHPAVVHGMQKEGVPFSQLEASKPSAMYNRNVGHTHGSPPSMAKLPQPIDLATGIDDDISRVAAEVQRETGYTVL